MKIGTILITAFLFVAIFGSVGGTYYFYLSSSKILESQVVDHLETTLQTMKNFIENFLDEQKDKIEIAATHSELSIEELKEIRDINEAFSEVFVLDSSGKIITSSDESHIGLDKSTDAYFTNARDKTYIKPIYHSETTKKNEITVSTPHAGGILVARIDLEFFNKITSDRTGLGETGESLLAYKDEDEEIVFFTERRFEEEETKEEEEEGHIILPMEEALKENEDIYFHLHDYRHISVISATKYIEEINVGIVTKVDEAEALGIARNQLIKTSLIIIIIISIMVGFIGFFVSRLVSKPIKKIAIDVDEITKGKLDIQLGKSNIYEIQILIGSLNRILASLKLAILRTGTSKSEIGIGAEIKAKEEAEDRHKLLYETSSDAIMTIEPPTWKFTDANQATIKIFGAKNLEEFKTKGPWDVSPEKQPNGKSSTDMAKKRITDAMTTGSNLFEWTHKRLTGEEFRASVLLTKLKIGGKEVLQATVRDLGAEKQKIQQANIEAKKMPVMDEKQSPKKPIEKKIISKKKIISEEVIPKQTIPKESVTQPTIKTPHKKPIIKTPIKKPVIIQKKSLPKKTIKKVIKKQVLNK